MSARGRLLLGAALVVLLAAPLAWATPGAGGAPGSSEQVDLGSTSDRQRWVKRIRDAQRAVDDARQRQDEAAVDYTKARSRRRARGEAMREILEEREQSSEALEQAQRRLEETLADARRAGVPPGWIREATRGQDPASPE